MAQKFIFFREREWQRLQSPGSDAVSTLMSTLTGGMLAPQQQPPPLQQQPLLPQQQPPPLPPMPPILPQQLPTASQSTEEMAMDVGTSQGDEQMTDGARAQQSGSQGPMEDANAT